MAAVAVQRTWVLPKGKVSPPAWLQLRATPELQASEAVADGKEATTAPLGLVAKVGSRSAGQVMLGGVVSTTVTVCVAVFVLFL